MPAEVIAVFDIGKTNKKFLLFDSLLNLVHQEEQKFTEIRDEEGFECDDLRKIETWMKETMSDVLSRDEYRIKALNFTTYGASLVHIDKSGIPLTPVYNYLKPMPEDVIEGFYERYGGMEEFCRNTASPKLGMLNSGLQALWLKRKRPEVFSRVSDILHFPQYLSFIFTGKRVSEFTSIGCHTAMWDFDRHVYHPWLTDENIHLPGPVPNSTVFDAVVSNRVIKAGIGIHDSSASLVPYFKASNEGFILMSTGTWCITMNPFNPEPLTADQLRKDTLCYLSINQQQVKSSRFFLGHIHDVNAEYLSAHYGVPADQYKKVKADRQIMSGFRHDKAGFSFFRNGLAPDFIDRTADLNKFSGFGEAYHRFMYDLVNLCMESFALIVPAEDRTGIVYISGGFARNEIFTQLLASRMPDKKVYTSEVDNSTALGAAMVVWEEAFGTRMPSVDIGLKLVTQLR